MDQQESIIARLETPTDKRQFVLFGREDAVSNRNQLNTYESGTGTPSINGYYGQKSTIFKLMSITKLSTSASFNWYEDGVTQSLTYASGPTAPIFNDATNKTSIGAVNVQSTPANFFQGSISEIIVTTDALSTAQRTAIENYLNKKYDLY